MLSPDKVPCLTRPGCSNTNLFGIFFPHPLTSGLTMHDDSKTGLGALLLYLTNVSCCAQTSTCPLAICLFPTHSLLLHLWCIVTTGVMPVHACEQPCAEHNSVRATRETLTQGVPQVRDQQMGDKYFVQPSENPISNAQRLDHNFLSC